MLLPPRKFDLRFMALSGVFSLSTNHLVEEYTGKGIYQRFGERLGFGMELPEQARRTKQLLREDLERRAQFDQKARAELEKAQRKEQSVLRRIWTGGNENWREDRAAEDRKAREEGKGLWDVIFDQVSEVWSDSKKGTPGDKAAGSTTSATASDSKNSGKS